LEISHDQRTFMFARAAGIAGIALVAVYLRDAGPNQSWLAAFLFACVPAATLVELRWPSERNPWSQPLFDTSAIAIGVLIAPAAWHAGAAIGALVVGKATARGSQSSPWVVSVVSCLLLVSTGFAAWWHGIDGSLPVLLGLLVAIPAVIYYAQREARRSERVRSDALRFESLARIAGGIGHDFNNLLMGISGNGELLAAELPGDHPARPALASLLSGVHRASLLSAQLVSFSGHAVAKRELLDLAKEAADLAVVLEAVVPKGTSVRIDAPGPLPPIWGDRAQLQQVLMNLILNAAESYASRTGTVEVVLREERDADGRARVSCTVRDRGCGIAYRDVPRIFEPFFSTKGAGRGLGLSSLRRVIADHGGEVAVESEPGLGSSFRIALPAATEVRARAPAPPRIPLARKRRILVIEDEPAVRRVVEQLLLRLGYDAEVAADGPAALELFQRHADRFDAVMLDLKMPGMDGWECLGYLDRIRPVPVLVSSGYDPSGTDAVPRPAGAPLAFIGKPFSGDALRGALEGLFV
jgi:signal transduction histidine kinase/CheY-like chemotaxis protein